MSVMFFYILQDMSYGENLAVSLQKQWTQMNHLGGFCSQKEWIYTYVFVQLEMIFVVVGRATDAEVAPTLPTLAH